MFLWKNESGTNVDKIDTIIGKNATFTGEIKTKGLLRIEGAFQGDIDCEKDLIIADGAKVEGKIKAKNAIIAGSHIGNVILEGKLEIKITGKVVGDIKVGKLVIEDGAFFDGKCEMSSDEKDKTSKAVIQENKLETNPI